MNTNILNSKKKSIKIVFNFKSFNNYDLEQVLQKIKEKSFCLQIKTSGIVSLPSKFQRFTVLRSPHVDKKSREQFEVKCYHKMIVVSYDINDIFTKQQIKLFINFIKNLSWGLSVKISYIV